MTYILCFIIAGLLNVVLFFYPYNKRLHKRVVLEQSKKKIYKTQRDNLVTFIQNIIITPMVRLGEEKEWKDGPETSKAYYYHEVEPIIKYIETLTEIREAE